MEPPYKPHIKKAKLAFPFLSGYVLGLFNPLVLVPLYGYVGGDVEGLIGQLITGAVISSIADFGFRKYSNKWISDGVSPNQIYWNVFVIRLISGLLLLLVAKSSNLVGYDYYGCLVVFFYHVQRIALNVPVLRSAGFHRLTCLLLVGRLLALCIALSIDLILLYWIVDIIIVLVYVYQKLPWDLSYVRARYQICEAMSIYWASQFVFFKENTIVPFLFLSDNVIHPVAYYYAEKIIHGIRSLYKPVNDFIMSYRIENALKRLIYSIVGIFIGINVFSSVLLFLGWGSNSKVYILLFLMSFSSLSTPIIAYFSNRLILLNKPKHVTNTVVCLGLINVVSLFFVDGQISFLAIQCVLNLVTIKILYRKSLKS